MKTNIVILSFLLFIVSASAQTKTKTASPDTESKNISTGDFDLQLYRKAITFGDYEVAKSALFNMIVKHPDSLNYLDSLVTLYFSLGQLPQCVFSGNEFLKKDTSSLSVREMVALSYSQLGKNKEALDIYEKMFHSTGNIYYAYQTAVQQYYLKRIGECNQMIDIIIKDPKSETDKIAISIDQSTQQQVPLKAAALNMRGIIFKELSMNDKAKESFEQALQVMPDFSLAKGNIDLLSQPEKKNENPAGDDKKEKRK